MKIVGDKVILRPIEEQDREMLLHLIRVPEIAKVTGGYSSPLSYAHQMEWFRSLQDSAGNLRSIIADKKQPEAGLGIMVLSGVDVRNGTGEIYIKLMESVRGRGYGRDAVNTLVSYAFGEMGLKHIYSKILENNTASRRLFEACGFKQEGTYKSKAHKDGHYENVCSYGTKAQQSCGEI